MRKQTAKRGFTITELIIVIVVIAILAAVLIPTFASLIKKANNSADVQAVRQMNTTLKADEAVNGKPANVSAMKAVLNADGITDFTPMYENNAFAWHKVDNVVILMDKETQKGTFPKEYKGVAYDATAWDIFGGTVNVAMSDLGANLDEAIANAKPGQTIVVPENSNPSLTTTLMTENTRIDLNGNTLTAPSGFDLDANVTVTISNGNLTSKRVDLNDGANLVLNDVTLTSTSSTAFYPKGAASQIDITGGTIIADTVIGTSYSDGGSQNTVLNLTNVTLGSADAPCGVAMSVINSSDVTITGCTIYATEVAYVSRAGNTTIENTTIYYKPTAAYNPTFFRKFDLADYGQWSPNQENYRQWGGGSGGMNAPIVIGDFHSCHYSVDANCTIKNVKVINETSYAYPDVYLSQENYDVVDWVNDGYYGEVQPGTKQIVKTYLNCDNSVTWEVNPGDNSEYVATCTGRYAVFANYAGFYVGTGYDDDPDWEALLLYVDNVFVNGVEQAKGSTSANPVPAN